MIDTGDPNTLIRNYLEAQYDENAIFVLARAGDQSGGGPGVSGA